MKTLAKHLSVMVMLLISSSLFAQGLIPDLQNYRENNYNGLNVFEDPKETDVTYDGIKVRLGGDFAMQFQGLDHSNTDTSYALKYLGGNFNLPVANLNLDVQFARGVRMHLRTYLSSRHHAESWVKGGHLSIDRLDFIKEGFLDGVMNVMTIKVGLDEINYGDAHFRRTDNARAFFNPFVGNYIMDSFSTEAFAEFYFRKSGWIAMLALSNGKLNQSVVKSSPDAESGVSFYGKVGYDNTWDNDLRFRLTGSWYVNGSDTRTYLWGGDRAGSRYYNVMETMEQNNDFSGRFNPRFNAITALQFNPFVKFKGLEFFGIYELAMDGSDNKGSYTQLGAELLYRFGSWEQLFIGGRYNSVTGKSTDSSPENNISRFNIGGGWFMTKNIMAKIEYVSQDYTGDGWNSTQYQGGNFNGVMVEAAISF